MVKCRTKEFIKTWQPIKHDQNANAKKNNKNKKEIKRSFWKHKEEILRFRFLGGYPRGTKLYGIVPRYTEFPKLPPKCPELPGAPQTLGQGVAKSQVLRP